jgi:hypothetical protein
VCVAHASVGNQRDRRYPAAAADVNVSEPGKKIGLGRFGRRQVAHDEVRDQCHAKRVRGGGRRHDRAGELEHRPEEVAPGYVVVDDQDMNPAERTERCFALPAPYGIRNVLNVGGPRAVLLPWNG